MIDYCRIRNCKLNLLNMMAATGRARDPVYLDLEALLDLAFGYCQDTGEEFHSVEQMLYWADTEGLGPFDDRHLYILEDVI